MEEELITKYVDCLISMGKASEAGDYRKNNRLHTIMISYYSQLKKMGAESVLKLKKYLTHEDDRVKCGIASHLLIFDEKAAVEVLEDLAKKPGLNAFEAEMVLKEWRNGNLKSYLETL